MDEWGNERGQGQEHNVSSKMQEGRLRWYGHVMRRPETYVDWRVMNMDPPGARGRGRPKKRWKDVVEEDMKEKGGRSRVRK